MINSIDMDFAPPTGHRPAIEDHPFAILPQILTPNGPTGQPPSWMGRCHHLHGTLREHCADNVFQSLYTSEDYTSGSSMARLLVYKDYKNVLALFLPGLI